MIPEFNEDGTLPPGIHRTELAEVRKRFGTQNETRAAMIESLEWLVDVCRKFDGVRLAINGSFVTDTDEPNDVDCIVTVDMESPQAVAFLEELDETIPYLSVFAARNADEWDYWLQRFTVDRRRKMKGIVEVIL